MVAAPDTATAFLHCVTESGLVSTAALDAYRGDEQVEVKPLAERLVHDGLLTPFQAGELMVGRCRDFLVGKYKILSPLGRGGMGQVFLAEHLAMKHRVALKILTARMARDKALRQRFQREGRAAAALNHPNVVRAFDFDQGDGFYYLVMEYVDGVNLQQLVDAFRPLDPARAAHYVAQAALGLQHIHEHGLVHRDLKPGNLVLDVTGVVKVLDLGLALIRHDRGESLTRRLDTKTILGTADYLSPEQAVESHSVDIRSDLYSLGATLYFLLAGRPPFHGQTVQKLVRHQLDDPDPLPNVPPDLARVVRKLLSKKPGDRYQTPIEVADALAPWTQSPIAPPTDEELAASGRHGPASRLGGASTARLRGVTPRLVHLPASVVRPAAAKMALNRPRLLVIAGLAAAVGLTLPPIIMALWRWLGR